MAGKRFLIVSLFIAVSSASATGNDLRIEPQSFRVGETAVVVVELEGSFATIDSIPLKLTNLRVTEGPFRSSEFRFINGRASRRRTFRWRVTASRAGTCTIGPVILVDDEGRRSELPQIEAKVLREPEPLSGEEADQLKAQLLSAGGVFVHTEIDSTNVWIGEQINVTWYLYAEDVRGVQVVGGPDLSGFWAEDLAIDDAEQTTIQVQGREVRKVPVRRMALFPTRAGELTIGSLDVVARILAPRQEPFGILTVFERRQVDLRRSAASLKVVAREIPEGASLVGDFNLECERPVVSPTGPAVLTVSVEGKGNLRSASPPTFEDSFDVPHEIEDLGVTVIQRDARILMRRRWRFVIFPPSGGELRIPRLSFRYFDSEEGNEATLSCTPQIVSVPRGTKGDRPSGNRVESSASESPSSRDHYLLPAVLLIGILLLGILGGAAAWLHRMRGMRSEKSRLKELGRRPADLRAEVMRLVSRHGRSRSELLDDPEELGDSFRSLISLIDLMEKEPWEIERVQGEVSRRAKEFVRSLHRG